jgi:hypothetical protein
LPVWSHGKELSSFTLTAVAALVAINRWISSIRLDDGTDDDSSGFRGCFISHPQKFSYIDGSDFCKVISKRDFGEANK